MTSPLVIFDLDGTLLDTAPDLLGALNQILREESLPAVEPSAVRQSVGHGARRILIEGFRQAGRTVDVERLDRLTLRFLDVYAARIAEETVPFPGILDALDRLEAAGVALAVCTNKREALALDLLGRLGLATRFRAIVGGDSLPVRKPHPDHIIGTVQRAGGSSAATAMVGDSDADINAARAAGIPVVAVSFGYSPEPIDSFGPNAVIDHYDQLDAALTGLSPVFSSLLAERSPRR